MKGMKMTCKSCGADLTVRPDERTVQLDGEGCPNCLFSHKVISRALEAYLKNKDYTSILKEMEIKP